MCFSPQRRAIFRHRNFKKCSKTDVLWTFSLQNVLLATAVYNFPISQVQKVLRSWRVLYIFTSKCASRHSGVLFFDIASTKKCFGPDVFCTCSLQNVLFAAAARDFLFLLWPHDSAPAALTGLHFDWPDTQNHWKNTAFRDFSNIWRGCIFFLLTFALWHLLSADLTTLLCFSTVHIVGS